MKIMFKNLIGGRRLLFLVLFLIEHIVSFSQSCSLSSLPINLRDSLVAYYPFCGNANDISGNANNGTVFGATLTTDRFGALNSAYSFNGVNNYILVPNSQSLSIQTKFSVSVWVLMDGGGCNPRVFNIHQNANSCGGYSLSFNGSSNTSRTLHTANFGSCNSTMNVIPPNSVPALTWQHIAYTVDASLGVGKFYINGQLVYTKYENIFASFNYNGNSLTIGNINSGRCDWWGGKIDDLLFYNRVLSACEITQLYNSTSTTIPASSFAINPFSDTTRLCGSSAVLNAGSGFSNYSWNNGGTTQAITASNNGIYKVTVANSQGCTASDSTYLSLVNATILNNDTTICAGSTVQLTVDTLLRAFKNRYSYLGSAQDRKFYLSTNRLSWLQARDSSKWFNGRLAVLNTIQKDTLVSNVLARMAMNDPAYIGLFQNTLSASYSEPRGGWEWISGDPLTYTNWASGEPNNSYQEDYAETNWTNSRKWNDGQSPTLRPYVFETPTSRPISIIWSTGERTASISVSPNQTTTYYVEVSDGVISCRDSVTITVNSFNLFNPLADTTSVCGTSVVLNAGSGYSSYSWNTGVIAQTTTATAGGLYKVTVTNSLGCSASDSTLVNILNSGIINNDTIVCQNSAVTLSTFGFSSGFAKDVDNNVYPTISIGRQIWFQRNLKVTKYRNGVSIPNITNSITWAGTPANELRVGAWCWFNNDSITYSATYGKLYNWWVVSNPNNIAPIGWHIPSISEMLALTNFLGGYLVAGGKLKEAGTNLWQSPNTGASNTSGFSARPASVRNYFGNFENALGTGAAFWTTDDNYASGGFGTALSLYHNAESVTYSGIGKGSGLSIRPISDNRITYLWSTGDTTSTITVSPSQSTTYYVTISDGISICRDSVRVDIFPNPYNPFSDTTRVCGSSAVLDAGPGYTSYLWNTGATTRTIRPTNSGFYRVTVTTPPACPSTSRDSTYLSLINNRIIGGDTTICRGTSATLCLDSTTWGTNSILCLSPNSGFTIGTLASGGNYNPIREVKFSNNKIFLAGQISLYNNTQSNGFIVLNEDGSVDPNFIPNQSTVLGFGIPALEIQPDNKILLGGNFSSYGGQIRNNIVRLNSDYTVDQTFNIGTGLNAHPWDIEIQNDGKILVAGAFTTYNGITRRNICRINSDGSLDASFQGNGNTSLNTDFSDISIYPDGKILVSGRFENFNSITGANSIVRLNSDGSVDNTFTSPITPGNIFNNALCYRNYILPDGKILVSGTFIINGISRSIIRLNADGSIDNSFVEPSETQNDWAFDFKVLPNNKILVMSNGRPGGFYRLNANGSLDNSFNRVFVSQTNIYTQESIAVKPNGDIIVGGGFTSVNGQSYLRIFQTNSEGIIRSCRPSVLWSTNQTTNCITVTPLQPSTYNVTLSDGINSCTTSVNVTLSPDTSITIIRNPIFCESDSAILRAGVAATYQWLRNGAVINGATAREYTARTSGAYRVVVVSTLGCRDTSRAVTVTVNPRPRTQFTVNSLAQCFRGNLFVFTNQSTISSGTMSYQWDFGNNQASTLTSPTYSYAAPGNYVVTLSVFSNAGCRDTASVVVTVNPQPVALFTVNDSTQCINGNLFSFTNQSSISSGTISYLWDFGNGVRSAEANPQHVYTLPGNYMVTLFVTSGSGCVDSMSRIMTVYPKPTPSFTVNATPQCLSGNNFIFTNTSTIAAGNLTFTWFYGDGGTSTSLNGSRSYALPGVYTVKLVAVSENGCRDSVTQQVTVIGLVPRAAFTVNNPSQCLRGNSFVFSNNSTISSGPMTYLWDFGNQQTSTLVNPVHSYTQAGTYTVTLIAISSNGCRDTARQLVIVRPQPQPSFTVNSSSQCQGTNNFVFTNTSSIVTGTMTYRWNFGDGATSTSSNTTHSYTQVGTYTVTLVATSEYGCVDSVQQRVIVNYTPTASFTINNASQCFVGNSFVFASTSTITSGTLTYLWRLGNAAQSTASTLTYSYPAVGTYTVTLVVTSNNGCVDSVQQQVVVKPNPVPAFTINDDDQCLRGNSFVFTNTTTLLTGTMQYRWRFGNGQEVTTTNASATYSEAGTYTVTLIATSDLGCVDSISRVVIVRPMPQGGVLTPTVTHICDGGFLTLTASGGSLYQWYLNGGAISGATGPSYNATLAGLYTVDLISAFGCLTRDTLGVQLTLIRKPVVSFTYDRYCAGTPSQFVSTSVVNSSVPVTYAWSFGTLSTSTLVNPVYTFNTSGFYDVQLKVVPTLCPNLSDSVRRTLAVEAPLPNERYPAENAIVNQPLQLSARSITRARYLWLPSTGLSADTIVNPVFTYNREQEYRIRITTQAGCEMTDTLLVRIFSGANIFVPEGFSPNGDGTNDNLRPRMVGVRRLDYFRVFNRWGQLMYETSREGEGWDGLYRGVKQPLETYVWMIQAVDYEGNVIKRTGSTLLLR